MIEIIQLSRSLIPSQNQLGEGPLWHPEEQALYWVDIHQSRVERFDPLSGSRQTFHIPQTITALGIRRAGGFVVSARHGFGDWDGVSEEVKIFARPEAHLLTNRFNDGAVGPSGHFWAGTMDESPQTEPPNPGSLYRLGADRQVECMQTGLTISNGLGWSPDGTRMYFTDTLRHTIYVYEHDSASGEIANRRDFVHDPDEPGVPDGLAVDREGFVWSARWGGWKLTRYDPDGRAAGEIILPVECPTSCTFGGETLNDLYITSAWTALSPAQRKAQPLAGDVFRVTLETGGLPETRFTG